MRWRKHKNSEGNGGGSDDGAKMVVVAIWQYMVMVTLVVPMVVLNGGGSDDCAKTMVVAIMVIWR